MSCYATQDSTIVRFALEGREKLYVMVKKMEPTNDAYLPQLHFQHASSQEDTYVNTHLLAGHELQGAVGAKVQHGIGLEDLLQVGVEGGKAVVGGGAP